MDVEGVPAGGIGEPAGRVPRIPDFGGKRREQREPAEGNPLRQEELLRHEAQLRQEPDLPKERRRRDRGGGVKGMMTNSPGGSIARGLEREAYVMGTPFEDAVVMRAAEDLAFGVRSTPQGTT